MKKNHEYINNLMQKYVVHQKIIESLNKKSTSDTLIINNDTKWKKFEKYDHIIIDVNAVVENCTFINCKCIEFKCPNKNINCISLLNIDFIIIRDAMLDLVHINRIKNIKYIITRDDELYLNSLTSFWNEVQCVYASKKIIFDPDFGSYKLKYIVTDKIVRDYNN
jgi:hypothetical protein